MRIVTSIIIKSMGEYSVSTTTKYEKRYKIYYRKFRHSFETAVNTVIKTLQSISSSNEIPGSYKFHKLNSYSMSVDGTRYDNVYDVHVPMNGIGSHDNLVLLFTYDNDASILILLDIGDHQQLNIAGTVEYQTPLVFI